MSDIDKTYEDINLSLDNINKAFDTIEKYQKEAEENKRISNLIESKLSLLLTSPDFRKYIENLLKRLLISELKVEVDGTENFNGDIFGGIRVSLGKDTMSYDQYNIKGSALRTMM